MDWKEIKEKSKLLQAEGKSEQEAAELLRDEIGSFAREDTRVRQYYIPKEKIEKL